MCKSILSRLVLLCCFLFAPIACNPLTPVTPTPPPGPAPTPTPSPSPSNVCPANTIFSTSLNRCLSVGPQISCNAYPEEASCIAGYECLWNVGTNKCVKFTPSDCPVQSTEGACISIGCIWDPGDDTCNSPSTWCSDARSDTVCNALNGCRWDGNANDGIGACIGQFDYCNGLGSSDCDNAKVCIYDSTQRKCLSRFSQCGSANTKETCGAGIFGISTCTWDESAGVCLSAYSSCSELNNSKATCDNSYLCSYDDDIKHCVLSSFPCSGYSRQSDCPTSSGCDWVPDLGCRTGVCFRREDKATCENDKCVWDATANNCLSPIAASCSGAQSTDACLKLGCLWNAGVSPARCESSYQFCTSRTNKEICTAQGSSCTWDDSKQSCISPWWPCWTYSVEQCPTGLESGCTIGPGTIWGQACQNKKT